MKKALEIIWLIAYTILAFAPIFGLFYMLGLKLAEQ
jgi:hypothetical protein